MPAAPTYLERYRAGEREAVWTELVALGDAVREEPLLSDARAVARETMTRARRNVETIVARLRELGYRFASPGQEIVPPDAALLARLDRLEAAAGPLPLALRAFFEVVGSVDLTGSHPRLSAYAGGIDLDGMIGTTSAALARHPSPAADAPPAPATPAPGVPPEVAALMGGNVPPGMAAMLANASAMIRELSQRMAQVQAETARVAAEGGPPSAQLLANYRLADTLAAGMQGPSSGAAPADSAPASDPLVVWAPWEDDLAAYHELGDPDDPGALDDEGWTGRYAMEIAPDACHKANTSGGGPYHVIFPDPAADAPVQELYAPSLVAYLRECFRWGGFPGLADVAEPPMEEVERLREGLLEI